MRLTINIIVLIISILFLFGCAAHSNLEPLGEKNLSYELSLNSNNKVMFADIRTGIDYGISDKVNYDFKLSVFGLIGKSFIGQTGFAYFPIVQDGWKPNVAINPKIDFFALDDVAGQAFPSITTLASWRKEHLLAFTGIDFENFPFFLDDKYELHPFIGASIGPRNGFNIVAEYKWMRSFMNGSKIDKNFNGENGYNMFVVSMRIHI